MNTPAVSQELMMKVLHQVIDPELGCNIVDLGLIYHVSLEGTKARVKMTLTIRGCPMHESIAWGVRMALLSLEEITDVDVETVWDPPWTPEMMTEDGKALLGVS